MTICVDVADLITRLDCCHESAIAVGNEPFIVMALPVAEDIRTGDALTLDMESSKWRKTRWGEAYWAYSFRDVKAGEVLAVPSRYSHPKMTVVEKERP